MTGAPTATAPRRLGWWGATGLGVGSMLGAGVFVVWSPAARAAGTWLVVAVALAAAVAALNAWSTARLAALHPVAGGAYAYGSRELRGPWGFVAGWGFVVGKTASVAAMALAIGTYAWPAHPEMLATLAVVLVWALNASGVARTAVAASVIAGAVMVGLAAVVGSAFASAPVQATSSAETPTAWSVAGAAALMFFAFAGYARLATLGEEVENPSRTIPRAMAASFAVVVVVYLALALALLRKPGAAGLAASTAPLVDASPGTSTWRWALAALAAAAAGGAMVALMAGLGRTAMAMARDNDAPAPLAATNRAGVPALAEGVLAAAAVGLVWWGSLGLALAVSSGAVLTYYAVAHAAAFARRGRDSSFSVPRVASGVGLVACVTLASSLTPAAIIATAFVLVLGVGVRAVIKRRGNPPAPSGVARKE